jgi:putative oxidoreductase
MDQLRSIAPLIGRILIGAFFIMAGLGKTADVAGFAGYMASGGVPAFLAWPAILFEILLGALLIVGFQVRLAALAGAAFCLLTALLYHMNFADQMQATMFFKNIAIAGGFLFIFAHGAGRFAVDRQP